jgi:chondroitin 4-sulfotransferase 11
MIISETGKFIFVHIQKNAGTSIEHVLQTSFSDSSVWHGRHGHAIDGIHEIGRQQWNRYFSLAFVRNPWERMVSWYSQIQAELQKLPPEKRASDAPFDSPFWNHAVCDSHDFESFLFNCTSIVYDNGCNKSFAFNQVDYMCDMDGTLAVDFVARFENLAKDSAQIFARLEVQSGRLPKWNKSRHRHYRHYYTPETRDLIASRFQRDIGMLGFEY